MRTLRRDIKGISISLLAIGLLAGSAVGVVAQDEVAVPGPEAATLVSGQLLRAGEDCGGAEFAEVTLEVGYLRERGRVCGGQAMMSDPRLSGEMTFMDDADRYIPRLIGAVVSMDDLDPYERVDLVDYEGFSDIVWGGVTIENDDGTWEGRSVGTSDITTDGLGVTYHELVGTGAYEGLSAVLFTLEDETGLPLTGVIFPGVLSDER